MSSQEFYARVRSLYPAARELPAEERYAFVEEQCAGDPRLKKELCELLGLTDPSPNGIPDWIGGALSDNTPDLDGYRILRAHGAGGMGQVYLAEQLDPSRVVAVEVIRHGLDIEEARARFRLECHQRNPVRPCPGIQQHMEHRPVSKTRSARLAIPRSSRTCFRRLARGAHDQKPGHGNP